MNEAPDYGMNTVESWLNVRVGTQKFGRRTDRDVQVKIIRRITPCKVFWTRLYQLDVYKREGLTTDNERRITETLL